MDDSGRMFQVDSFATDLENNLYRLEQKDSGGQGDEEGKNKGREGGRKEKEQRKKGKRMREGERKEGRREVGREGG